MDKNRRDHRQYHPRRRFRVRQALRLPRHIRMMKMIAFPFETGLSLKAVRTALNTLTDLGVGDQGSTSLFGDGTTINHCRTYDEIIDLLAAGREVFSVAVPVLIQNHLTTTSTPNPTQPRPQRERSGAGRLQLASRGARRSLRLHLYPPDRPRPRTRDSLYRPTVPTL